MLARKPSPLLRTTLFFFVILVLVNGLLGQFGLLKNLAHIIRSRIVAQVENEQDVNYLILLLSGDLSSEGSNKLETYLDLLISFGSNINPEDSDWTQLKGFSNLFQNKFEEAEKNFEHSASLSKNDPLLHFYLGIVYENSNQHDRAVYVWQQVPNIGTYFYLHGYYFYYEQSNYDLAAYYFETASELNPRLCESIYHQGLMWNELKLQESAMNTWSKVETTQCFNTKILGEILFQKGRLFAEMGKYDDAIENLNRAVALDETDLKRTIALGNAHLSNENYKEAISIFQEIRAMNPNELWPYIGLCHSERFQHHFSIALDWCAEAIKLYPDNPLPYYYTGLIFFDQHDFAQAIDWFEVAVSHQEANPIMYVRLGDSYKEIGEDLVALTIYEKALEIFPQDAILQQRVESLSAKN